MILCNPIGYVDENTVTLSFKDFSEPAYPSLAAVPGTMDLVNIFRKSEEVLPIVEAAITKGTKAVWLQEGIVNNAAAALAKQSGLHVVMDRCWLKEHAARSHRG
jgi:predicted CoA-binding protein